MYSVHNGRSPSYLSDMMQPADTPSRPLRTKFGERAFSHCGPAAWNQLPEHTRQLLSQFSSENLKQSCSHIVLHSPLPTRTLSCTYVLDCNRGTNKPSDDDDDDDDDGDTAIVTMEGE